MDESKQYIEKLYERGSFDELFESLSGILCYFERKGFFYSVLDEVEIPNSISHPLILRGIKLITEGACDARFFTILDFEFYKILKSKISDDDLAEIILAKKSLVYLRELDVNNFFELLNSFCSRALSSKLIDLFSVIFKDEFDI